MKELEITDLNPDPIVQFEVWFAEAREEATLNYPNAMVLSTVNQSGEPNSRVVLLKEINPLGFCFFTNTHSVKGEELASSPKAALNFYWDANHRQIRVQGSVSPVSPADADTYFKSRNRLSQLGAWASQQSRELSSREQLEEAVRDLEEKFSEKEVPRPPHWSGYLLSPTKVEFWQEREGRLHDRFRYTKTATNSWQISRLYP